MIHILLPILVYAAINIPTISCVHCFVSKLDPENGLESGLFKQECPHNTICTLAEEIVDTTSKKSKFRDCLNEKMCQLLDLKCSFCDTDFCVPEMENDTHSISSTYVKCVQCNDKNDSYCLTRTDPVLACSRGEICVTFGVSNFDGKIELERGCSNKEVCNHIGNFCSWCDTEGCVPKMPRIMYLRNIRQSSAINFTYNIFCLFSWFIIELNVL
ncbi:hypothetical protein HHI36_018421 [Cryptolaemus montrouzieri]|uniref:Sodefrin-like factor n=1 Tax=Cryptolaemus montrouzieri TaxID=559131 RepID=A0ABD2P0K7_9CUCU